MPELPDGEVQRRCAHEHAVGRELARILDAGVDGGQVPAAEDFLIEVRDDDEPRCPRCDAALERGAVAGRTSLWCPREQPVPS